MASLDPHITFARRADGLGWAAARGHLCAAENALHHAARFARDGRFPDVLADWTAEAAAHLLVVRGGPVAPSRVSAPRRQR